MAHSTGESLRRLLRLAQLLTQPQGVSRAALLGHDPVASPELQQVLGVLPTSSVLARQLALLKEIGVEVERTRDAGGTRYRLVRPVPFGDNAEVDAALKIVAKAFAPLGLDAGFAALLDAVTMKPEPYPFVWRTGTRPPPRETLAAVHGALVHRKALRFGYRGSGDAEARVREVEPLSLVADDGAFLLHAWEDAVEGTRLFKLQRMQQVAVLPRRARRDAAAVADRDWEAGLYDGPSLGVVLRFSARRAKQAREYHFGARQAEQELPGGGVEISFEAAGVEPLVSRVLSWGSDVEVVLPEALRQRVGEEVRAMAARE
jgi:proteasome accessory factor C